MNLKGRTELFTWGDCREDSNKINYEGEVIVISVNTLADTYKKPEYQLWVATGGFGCNPLAGGSAVFATALFDGENARWRDGQVIGVLKPELVEEYEIKIPQ